MKPIFAIDITDNKRNETVNGKEFVTKSVSKESFEELEKNQEELEETLNAAKLPLLWRVLKALCGYGSLIILISIVKALRDVSLDEAFRNAPLIFAACPALAAVWGVLYIFSKKKESEVLKEQNAESRENDIDRNVQDIYNELGVPHEAATADVLMFRYKIKNGELRPATVGLQNTAYIALEIRIYAQNGELCIADLEDVYTFKLSELKAIKTVKKRIAIPLWNKDEEPTEGEFKKYKLSVNNMGEVLMKPYHVLEIERDGETYGIYFPCYELAVFECLTGLKAEE